MTNFDPFLFWDPKDHPLGLLAASLVFDIPGHMSPSGPVGLWKYSFMYHLPPHNAYLAFFLLISITDHNIFSSSSPPAPCPSLSSS